MTQTTHTPGPWTLQAGRSFDTASGTFYLSYGADKHGNPNFRDFCELDRNARLVAAAPDLLAALESLFEHCAMPHKHWGDGNNAAEADAAIAAGRAAIRKAKGE